METSVKNVATGKALNGFMKNIALRLRVIGISSQNALPSEMFTYGVPYEASRTYRAMKAEFDRNRSIATIEAHHQALRGS